MKYGIIAMIDSQITGKQPNFLGYDLVGKPNPNPKYERSKMSDFILHNQGIAIENGDATLEHSLSIQTVKSKLNQNIMRLFESHGTQQKTATPKTAEESKTYPVNGKVVKAIFVNGDKYQAEFLGDNPEEARDIFVKIQAIIAWSRLVLEKHKLELKAQLKEGTLDLTADGEVCIIKNGKALILTDDCKVTKKDIKKTLFYLMSMYQSNTAFNKHLNCSFEEGDYVAEFKSGKFSVKHKTNELSQLEKNIFEDLMKFQESIEGE